MKRSILLALTLILILSFTFQLEVSAASGSDVVLEAERWLGSPYVYGQNGSGGPGSAVDCSGLTLQVYKKFGITLPHSSYSQATMGTYVAIADMQPGDLMCFKDVDDGNIGHVGIYAGGGYVINALNKSTGVIKCKWGNAVATGNEVRINENSIKLEFARRFTLGDVPTNSSGNFSNAYATEITTNNAKLYASLSSDTYVTSCGFYLGTTPSNMTQKTEYPTGYVRTMWYYMDKWYGALQPGTTYYYSLYYVSGGTTYKTETKSFTTLGGSSGVNSGNFSDSSATEITTNNARLNASISPDTYVTTCGFYLGTSESNMTGKTETINGYVNTMWYYMDKWYGALQPKTMYYYYLYYVNGGTTYRTQTKSFTTQGIPLTGITMNKTSASLQALETVQLSIGYVPSNTTAQESITWSSSNTSVATISGSGLVTAWDKGTTTIEARSSSGFKVTCQVTVTTSPQPTLATSVSLNKTSGVLYTAEALTLTATVLPSNTTNNAISWRSSNETVATVNSVGAVTAVSAGTATITATTTDGSGKSASCQITVKQYATGLALDRSTATLYTGGTLTLNATVSPSDTSDKRVTWASSDTAVATVNNTGLVNTLKAGTATITATTADGSNKSASCVVTIKKYATGVTLDKTSWTLYTGGTLTLTATVSPSDTSDKRVAWSSSDTAVATVSSSGVVTGVKAGTATITATSVDGSNKSATCAFTVWTPAASVTIGQVTQAKLKPGDVLTLSADVQPANAHDRSVTWTSSNSAIAQVQGGVVTAVTRGTATITATTHNGKTATCAVTVEDRLADPATGVQISTETGAAYVNYKAYLQLTATVSPKTAENRVTWKSSNTRYVTVDANGRVYGKKVGKATIYATAADGSGVRGSIAIQVITPVTGVRLPETDKIFIGKTKKLAAALTPSKPTFKALNWQSDNNAVATVAADGTVTAVAPGTVLITATAYNGLSDSCTVTVAQPVTGIRLAPENGFALVYKGEKVQLVADVSPANAGDKGLAWKTSSAKYAVVDAQGYVTGKSPGKVKITATAKDGSGVTGSVSLTIAAPATSIKLNKSGAVLYHNGTGAQKVLQLTATASPKGSKYRSLTWSVLSGDAATVNETTGLVTALKDGTAVIRATTDNGRTADCAVTVRTLPVTFNLNTTEKTLSFKQSFNLGAEAIFDARCTEKALTWKSSNTKVATVSSLGMVKANKSKAGKATITAMTKNGIKASCVITVVKSLPKGATGTPAEEAVAPRITLKLMGGDYTSSDNHVADVDGNGKVGLKADGAATLEAGGKLIAIKVEGGNLTEVNLDEGVGLMVTAGEGVRWAVRDGEIATIDKDGLLTALRKGATTLTCKAENGGECAIRIVVTLPDTKLPQPALEPSAEPEQGMPEPTLEPKPTVTPEPEPTAEPTAAPEPEPLVELEPTAAPEPETLIQPEPTAKPGPVPEAPSDTQTDTGAPS